MLLEYPRKYGCTRYADDHARPAIGAMVGDGTTKATAMVAVNPGIPPTKIPKTIPSIQGTSTDGWKISSIEHPSYRWKIPGGNGTWNSLSNNTTITMTTITE